MPNRSPLSAEEKAYLIRRKQAGATHQAVANELQCAWETVRKHWQRQRRGRVAAKRGRPKRGALSTYPANVRAKAVEIKQAHPHWGPANVRIELQKCLALSEPALPSPARLAALFKAECPQAVQPHQSGLFRQVAPGPVRQPHQRWQLDAKESVPLPDGTQVTVLEARDPAGGLMILSQVWVTPSAGGGGCRKLTLCEIRASLRLAFARWGRPLEIQTDHEGVYVGAVGVDFPSLFTLWLAGLGITHVLSRHRRPTDQPQAERQHRTAGDMVWKDDPGATPAELQARLDACHQRYHLELPVRAAHCQGQPPLVYRPWASHSGRTFDPAVEADLFDLGRVGAFLSQLAWRRKVSSQGTISLGHHVYAVGRRYVGEELTIRFQTDTWTFQFTAPNATPIAKLPAQGLSWADLLGEEVASTQAPTHPYQFPLPLQGV
jgi:transposase-like protein